MHIFMKCLAMKRNGKVVGILFLLCVKKKIKWKDDSDEKLLWGGKKWKQVMKWEMKHVNFSRDLFYGQHDPHLLLIIDFSIFSFLVRLQQHLTDVWYQGLRNVKWYSVLLQENITEKYLSYQTHIIWMVIWFLNHFLIRRSILNL